MFGMDCFIANGKAAGGLSGEDMVFKLTVQAAREQALSIEGADLFEPMEGRTMKEWASFRRRRQRAGRSSPRLRFRNDAPGASV